MRCPGSGSKPRVLLLLPLLVCSSLHPGGSGFGQNPVSWQLPFPRRPIAHPVRAAPRKVAPSTSGGSATTTTLTFSAATVEAGTAVTLTAKVTSGKTAVAPGIVLFCNSAYSVCAGPGMMAQAVLNPQGEAARTLMLPVGSYSIKASFQGTSPYEASASALQSLTVEGNSTYYTKATLTSVAGSEGKYALGASLQSHAPAAPAGGLLFTNTTTTATLGSVELPETALGGYQPFGLITTGAKSGPNDLAMGDFNGDGIPDLAAPDSATGVVAVFLGKGDGTFQPAMNASTGQGSTPLAIAVADFNGDGKLDLAVALGNQAAVAILLGNGDGTFQPPRIVPTAGSALYYPLALTVGDFNHDGRLDIATANNSVGASLLFGNGDGSFQPFKLLGSSQGPTWIAAGDFNNDGNLDLGVTTAADTVDISLGNGDGTFQTYTSIATGSGTNPQSLAALDLDGDGNLDLVVACYGANAVGVLLGNGDGTFLPIEFYAAGAGPIAVTTGDLNLDGIPDLVVTNLSSSSLSLFEGDGDGTFLPLPGYSTTSGSQPAASVVADLNADGTPEIVSVLYGSSALYVLETGRMQGVLLKDVALSTVGTVDLTVSYAGDNLYADATSAVYAFTGSATTTVAPAFSPPAGPYATAQSVTLTSSTPGALIYYTLNGSTPTAKSFPYAGPIPVNASMTISAIAIAAGFTNSSVATAAYAIGTPAAAPVFAPAAGTYTGTQKVALSSATPGAAIYYTLNSSAPTIASAKYSGLIAVSANTTIEAIALAAKDLNSPVSSATYAIRKPILALTSSVSAPKAGQSIKLTAKLAAPGAVNIAGKWVILDGATQLCAASETTQSSYACTVKLAKETHKLSARYTGKTNGWKLIAGLTLVVK